jgi:hypothetical protein
MAAVQYVRQAGSDPAFLRKALGEASGELRRALDGVPRRMLMRHGEGKDEDWCLLSQMVHLRDVERGFNAQTEAILGGIEEAIPHVDIDGIPFEDEYREEDEDEVLEEFHYLRRHTAYMLWDLMPGEWERAGVHPYRGRVTLLQLVREMYQHDLEHLWQVRRMIEAFTAGARR